MQDRKQASEWTELMALFQRWLPNLVVERLVKENKGRFYNRLLPPALVLWGFVYQRLNADHTCDAAWSYLSEEHIAELYEVGRRKSGRRSGSNSAYCQGRKRLPEQVAWGALRVTAGAIQEELEPAGLWQGWRVNLFDGSTIRLAATQALREHYGVASNQHGASHWPLMRVVAGFDLFSGAVNGASEGAYSMGEQTLAVQLIQRLGSGFLHIGDRNFGVYHILQAAHAAESQALLRLKITQAKRLGQKQLQVGCDLDVIWETSRYDTCESDLPTPPIAGRLIYVRLEKAGFRPIDLYLFTTLTDREQYPVSAIVQLYGYRWRVELQLRHVKTNLDMESLSGKSVDTVRKELALGLLAFNLLRGLMAVAALRAGRLPLQLSLSQCRRRLFDVSRYLSPRSSDEQVAMALEHLLQRMGKCVLPQRHKERFEPRAVWGKPRVFPTIKGSRDQARLAWLQKLMAKS